MLMMRKTATALGLVLALAAPAAADGMRARAMAVHGDPWAEDPGCYLSEGEVAQH